MYNDFEDGKWRQSKFHNFIWDNIALTALSAREREALGTRSNSQLVEAAKNLRLTDIEGDDPGKGSELAEIALYAIMHHHFGALPVVPKIFYKQNSQDNVKGADSVHIVATVDDYTIWLGEAKFYNSIKNARLDKIVESVEDTVSTLKIKKDNAIITNLQDLDKCVANVDLCKKIREELSSDSPLDGVKQKLHIPILLLHECEITQGVTELSDEYLEGLKTFHLDRANSYFSKQLKALSSTVYKYQKIMFHLILFPVPKKDSIVRRFLTKATFHQQEGNSNDAE
ncbi:DUF1837 domain-containing protein [Luteolibacter algae]|uniref:DUF1837 domain-containing protein n=1 Tax=Luteolibacter algae TaxID=454151 RepID=A0ABW5D9E3_9BACT